MGELTLELMDYKQVWFWYSVVTIKSNTTVIFWTLHGWLPKCLDLCNTPFNQVYIIFRKLFVACFCFKSLDIDKTYDKPPFTETFLEHLKNNKTSWALKHDLCILLVIASPYRDGHRLWHQKMTMTNWTGGKDEMSGFLFFFNVFGFFFSLYPHQKQGRGRGLQVPKHRMDTFKTKM